MKMKSKIPPKLFLAIAVNLITAITATAQYDAGKIYNFIQDVYNRHDKNLNDFLIAELQDFVNVFPDDEKAAEAGYLLATIYEANGDKHEALVSHFKGLYLFPNSTKQAASTDAARKIINTEKSYTSKKEKLLAILDGQFSGDSAADRYFTFLAFLKYLDHSNLYKWTLNENKNFISRFPDDERIDKVLQWVADVQDKMGDHREAEASYLKLDYASPESPLLPEARYRRGAILYKELGENEKAVEVFSQLVSAFPDSELYAGSSLFMLGEIKQKKLKDYKGSIADYRKLVDTYPKNDLAVDAFFAMAELYEDKLATPTEAIKVYDEFVQKYPGDERGIKALEKAADIYKSTKMQDYAKAAEYYAKIAELFPTYEKAPDMLLRAGDLCEGKLKDPQKATLYYQMVVDKFPENRFAGEAKRRIGKLQAKAGE
jgi:TolA-binding protein